MFTNKELLEQDRETDKQEYIFIMNSDECCSGINGFDISIFTKEEWNYVRKLEETFHNCQIDLENMSDGFYSWMFSKENPNREQNCLYEKKIYWMDRQFKSIFGIKIKELLESTNYLLDDIERFNDNETYTRQEMIHILEKLKYHYGEEKISKNEIRKWFIENFSTFSMYYNTIK